MDVVEDTMGAYDHSFEDYEAKHMDPSGIKDKLELFLFNVDGERILDVGCGPGRDLKYFSERGFESTGLDILPKAFNSSLRNAPKATVYLGDMRDMNFVKGVEGAAEIGDDSFDGLWSMASMLHLPRDPIDDAAKAMREYSRVLREGGTLYLSVMKGNGPNPLHSSKYGGHSKFFYSYGEQELKDLVRSVGFEIDKFEVQEKVPTKVDPKTKELIGKEVTFLNLFATNYK